MKAGSLVLDIALFAGTVALAAAERWQAADLIWGLWISSLLLGYASIVMGVLWSILSDAYKPPTVDGSPAPIAAGLAVLPNAVALWLLLTELPVGPVSIPIALLLAVSVLAILSRHLPLLQGGRPLLPPNGVAYRLLTRWPMIALLLTFFTVHFVGFHVVHGLFVNSFFPIVPGNPGGPPLQLLLHFADIVRRSISLYWPFVAISAVGIVPGYVADLKAGRWTLFSPYKNVVRMHLMIFIFAGLFAAGLRGWSIYPVLVLYFFPWGALAGLFRRKPRVDPPTG